jgi:hypothetical protein
MNDVWTPGERIDKEKPPGVICPACKGFMVLDLAPFHNDVTKVMKSRCPMCNATIFACLIFLANTNPRNLASDLETVQGLLKKRNRSRA